MQLRLYIILYAVCVMRCATLSHKPHPVIHYSVLASFYSHFICHVIVNVILRLRIPSTAICSDICKDLFCVHGFKFFVLRPVGVKIFRSLSNSARNLSSVGWKPHYIGSRSPYNYLRL